MSQNPTSDTTTSSNDAINDESSHKHKTWPKPIWKPTQHVKDILEGIAKSSNLPKSCGQLAKGIQLPTETQNDEQIPVNEPTICQTSTSKPTLAAVLYN